MIERFSQTHTLDQLIQRFKIEPHDAYAPNYNASPSQLIPVITHHSPQGISFFYWGLAPRWVKNKVFAEKTINLRAEQVVEKPVMQKTLTRSRCIIPADGFYTWKKIGKKTTIPWRFTTASKDVLSFAGIWEEFEDDGEVFHTFLLITTPAMETVSEVCDRAPLVLDRVAEKIWMDQTSSADQLISILQAGNSVTWNGYSVSPQLNDLNFNKPSLLLPAPPADQFGNLTLFN